jgi:hypothetical protein
MPSTEYHSHHTNQTMEVFDERSIGSKSNKFVIVCSPRNDAAAVRRATEIMTLARRYREVVFMTMGLGCMPLLERTLFDGSGAVSLATPRDVEKHFLFSKLNNTLIIVPPYLSECSIVRHLAAHSDISVLLVANRLDDMPGSVRANADYIMFGDEQLPTDIVQAMAPKGHRPNPLTVGHADMYPVFNNFASHQSDEWCYATKALEPDTRGLKTMIPEPGADAVSMDTDAVYMDTNAHVPVRSKLNLNPLPKSPTSASNCNWEGGQAYNNTDRNWVPSPEKVQYVSRTTCSEEEVDNEQKYIDAMDEAVRHSESAWLSQASENALLSNASVTAKIHNTPLFSTGEGDIFANVNRVNTFEVELPISHVTVQPCFGQTEELDNQHTLQTTQESIATNQGVMHDTLTSLRSKADKPCFDHTEELEILDDAVQTIIFEQERTTDLLVDNQHTLQTNQESIAINQGVMHDTLCSLRSKVDELFHQFTSCLSRISTNPSMTKSKKKKKSKKHKKKKNRKEGEEKEEKTARHRSKEEQQVVQAAFNRWVDATAREQEKESEEKEAKFEKMESEYEAECETESEEKEAKFEKMESEYEAECETESEEKEAKFEKMESEYEAECETESEEKEAKFEKMESEYEAECETECEVECRRQRQLSRFRLRNDFKATSPDEEANYWFWRFFCQLQYKLDAQSSLAQAKRAFVNKSSKERMSNWFVPLKHDDVTSFDDLAETWAMELQVARQQQVNAELILKAEEAEKRREQAEANEEPAEMYLWLKSEADALCASYDELEHLRMQYDKRYNAYWAMVDNKK